VSDDLADGDLARLARDGDAAAFRLLVERHQPMIRARARGLCANPSDVDDVVQEAFLQAFLGLDRLRDPDRFGAWLAGITANVARALHRRGAPLTLLSDWPEPLHPSSAGGLPTPEDLDRADALRTAVAGLPAGQRRAVTLHYYADVPAGQVAEPPGAARAALHKARLRLRAYLTEHRPDLVPASGRMNMTTVRVARIESAIPPGPVPDRVPTHVIVLADDHGRDLPIWLLGRDSHRFTTLTEPGEPTADELTGRLLHAAGARVTGVELDELGPEVPAARIDLAVQGAEPAHITVRLLDGLALAITTGAPIRVTDTVLDRLAVPAGTVPGGKGPAGTVPAGTGPAGPMPEQTARDMSIDLRPRYEPRNLTFAAGLDHWVLGGSFTEHALQAHWHDYQAAARDGAGVLTSAVPQPEGFAWLAQEIFADDYRGATVTFRGQVRVTGGPGRAGLFLRVMEPRDVRGPMTVEAALADPANHLVTIEGHGDWTTREVTATIPAGTNTLAFGIFLAGPGGIELRDTQLTRDN
jgi:RNA polymerase sigma-70 factor (ECF subfamily)